MKTMNLYLMTIFLCLSGVMELGKIYGAEILSTANTETIPNMKVKAKSGEVLTIYRPSQPESIWTRDRLSGNLYSRGY